MRITTDLERVLYAALKEISQYQTVKQVKRQWEETLGEEAVEMAYENVLATAKRAIKGVKV